MPEANYDAIKIIVDVVQFLVIGAVGVWMWLVQRNDNTAASVSEHAERLSTLEAQIQGVPGHSDLESLRKEIGETRSAVERAVGQLEQITRQLGMINEHLLNEARNR
jgi:hypothetical protein